MREFLPSRPGKCAYSNSVRHAENKRARIARATDTRDLRARSIVQYVRVHQLSAPAVLSPGVRFVLANEEEMGSVEFA